MKLTKPKRLYYMFIILVCALSLIIFLNNFRSLNRKFNPNILNTVFTLYTHHIQSTVPNYQITKLPFKLIEDKSMNLTIHYEEKTESIYTNNMSSLLKLLSSLNLFNNTSANTTISSIKEFPIRKFKYINLYFLISDESNLTLYQGYIERIKAGNFNKIFIKFIYYDKFKGVSQSEDLYTDLKNYNNKLLFEEFEDKTIQHVLLHNRDNSTLSSFYNKDLDVDIFELDLRKFLNVQLLEGLICFTGLLHSEKASIPNAEALSEVIKITNSKTFIFHQLILKSIKNLDKVNQIFSLYESIRSIEIIKEKVIHIRYN